MPPQLRDYEISGVLHRGSTGTTYAARFRRTGHTVAVEEIASDLRSTPGFRERLAETGRQATSLRHPRTITVYNLVQDGDTLCLVTELPSGRPLRGLVPRGAVIPPATALAIVDDVLGAVEAAHRLGIIHGDVRPEAITVTREGHAKLGGFAIALALATTPGGPAWRRAAYSPDRSPGTDVSEADDVHACAALAHELLTGAPPGEHVEELPPEIAPALELALDPGPRRRMPSASALRTAIVDAAVRGYGTSWKMFGDLPDRVSGTIPPPTPSVAVAAAPEPRASPAPVTAAPPPTPPESPSRQGERISVPPPTAPRRPLVAAAPIPASAAPPARAVRRRRRLSPFALLVGLGVLALIGAAVLLFGGGGGPPNAGPLQVGNDVKLSVEPPSGGCNTTFTFVATGSLHGSGTLTYQFVQSDGHGSDPTPVTVTSDEGSFRFTRSWRLQDTQTVNGTMTFKVLSPQAHSVAQTFTYACK